MMTIEDKKRIAASFPIEFEEAMFGVHITSEEYCILYDGIFSKDMDSKWHIFGLNDIIFFARSWTSFCVYKVFVKEINDGYLLEKIQVNRNQQQYRSWGIEQDIIWLKRLLKAYLQREDLFVEPELSIPIIKKTIEQVDPNNEYKKSVGSNNIGLTRSLHSSNDIGWLDLEQNLKTKPKEEPLISVFFLRRDNPKDSFTLYFNKEGSSLLGRIQKKSP